MNMTLCTLTWKCVVLTGWIATLVAVVIVMLVYFLLKYLVLPKMKDEHEKIMKEDAFNREKEWFFIKKTEKPLEEELKEYKEKLEAFQKKETEMNERIDSLNKEKDEFEKNVLKTKIKIYEEITKNHQ